MKHITILIALLLTGCTTLAPTIDQSSSSSQSSETMSSISSATSSVSAGEWTIPLPRATERITKKPFGINIDPKTSPVQPERFSGYHSGTDFEIFPEEKDIDVPVKAVCSGAVSFAGFINGYGGVLVQKCTFEGQTVTVLYGHLRVASIKHQRGESLTAGEVVANLGSGFSDETDRERKHLHLSIHKGAAIEYRGYSASEEGLSEWVDPMSVLR